MSSLEDKVKREVDNALDDAEKIWDSVGDHFIKKAKKLNEVRAYRESSEIPGFPYVEDGKPKVADFIALVLDIRNSTKHLIEARSPKPTQLERVLYETTAINTAGSVITSQFDGKITEFLGDGFLALYKVDNESDPKPVYNAHDSAKKCLDLTSRVINTILKQRYSLPPLQIGIGMSYSKAIVTLVGHKKNLHPKAIGECVYRASKLSDGSDKIFIDDRLEMLWPTSKNGKLNFLKTTKGKITAYEIKRS